MQESDIKSIYTKNIENTAYRRKSRKYVRRFSNFFSVTDN